MVSFYGTERVVYIQVFAAQLSLGAADPKIRTDLCLFSTHYH